LKRNCGWVHPSSTCFRWQFLPPILRLDWPLSSVLFIRKPLISIHSLVLPGPKTTTLLIFFPNYSITLPLLLSYFLLSLRFHLLLIAPFVSVQLRIWPGPRRSWTRGMIVEGGWGFERVCVWRGDCGTWRVCFLLERSRHCGNGKKGCCCCGRGAAWRENRCGLFGG